MAGGEEKSRDFYAVLGLKKECTASELRDAYKKLALRWHPDRCSAPGNSKSVDESKKKFQAIQHAYSVLSDENKRFLYDVGVYESDDDESGMGDFLSEMAVMMSRNDSNENGGESLEELQQLFDEMFQGDMEEAFASTSRSLFADNDVYWTPSSSSCSELCPGSSNKRSSVEMRGGRNGESSSGFNCHFQDFCLGLYDVGVNGPCPVKLMKSGNLNEDRWSRGEVSRGEGWEPEEEELPEMSGLASAGLRWLVQAVVASQATRSVTSGASLLMFRTRIAS